MRYVEEFLLARRLDELAKGTLRAYERELKLLSSYLQKPTINASVNDLRMYFLQFKESKSESTMCNKISMVKAYYTWLVDEDKIEKSPTKHIKTPKEPITLPKNLNHQDFERLRYVERSPRNQAIVELLASSGMRIGEMVPLNRNDLDMENRLIKVRGKGNKERIVHFSTVAKFCLLTYLGQRKDDNPALFVNRLGGRLGVRSIEQQIKAEAKRAGIRAKVTPHVLRHTFASNLYANGADVGFISMELGHASPETTMRYARLDMPTRNQMYEKFLSI